MDYLPVSRRRFKKTCFKVPQFYRSNEEFELRDPPTSSLIEYQIHSSQVGKMRKVRPLKITLQPLYGNLDQSWCWAQIRSATCFWINSYRKHEQDLFLWIEDNISLILTRTQFQPKVLYVEHKQKIWTFEDRDLKFKSAVLPFLRNSTWCPSILRSLEKHLTLESSR